MFRVTYCILNCRDGTVCPQSIKLSWRVNWLVASVVFLSESGISTGNFKTSRHSYFAVFCLDWCTYYNVYNIYFNQNTAIFILTSWCVWHTSRFNWSSLRYKNIISSNILFFFVLFYLGKVSLMKWFGDLIFAYVGVSPFSLHRLLKINANKYVCGLFRRVREIEKSDS